MLWTSGRLRHREAGWRGLSRRITREADVRVKDSADFVQRVCVVGEDGLWNVAEECFALIDNKQLARLAYDFAPAAQGDRDFAASL